MVRRQGRRAHGGVVAVAIVGWVSGKQEMFRQARPDAFFDDCLAREDPEVCLLQVNLQPLDPDACIDDVPKCPE